MKQKDLRRVKFLCICLLPLLAFVPSPGFRLIQGKCVRVLDGDTIELKYGGALLKLRLAFIDAPELKQLAFDRAPIGLDSKVFLENLVLGHSLKVKIIKKDRYGRYLSQLFLGPMDVNLSMVQNGQALIYRYYEFENTEQRIDYMTSEIVAKKRRLGVWKTFGFYDPYAYRRLGRHSKRRNSAKN